MKKKSYNLRKALWYSFAANLCKIVVQKFGIFLIGKMLHVLQVV